MIMVNMTEPVFNLGEEVVLLLFKPSESMEPPPGFESVNYYRVVSGILGKGEYKNDSMIREVGDQFAISEIEKEIASTSDGE
jgi:hypothetical protein